MIIFNPVLIKRANFSYVGSRVAESRRLKMTVLHFDLGYRPYNIVSTNVLHCDFASFAIIYIFIHHRDGSTVYITKT